MGDGAKRTLILDVSDMENTRGDTLLPTFHGCNFLSRMLLNYSMQFLRSILECTLCQVGGVGRQLWQEWAQAPFPNYELFSL